MDLSVIVSTFNRAVDLARFIESMMKMDDRGVRHWELIVIDNNSTDDTRAVVDRAIGARPSAVRYLFEGRQGKSFGLNSGLAIAKGRIVAFTDDDAIVSADWADSILDFFNHHPEAMCVGGRVDLYNPTDATTSTRTWKAPFEVDLYKFSAQNIPIIGCNMAFRHELVRSLGPFDTNIGPGSKCGVAEDLDYLYRVVRSNYVIYYDPTIRVMHNHGRRSVSDLQRLAFNYLTGRGAFYCKHVMLGDRYACRLAWWEARNYFGWRTLRAMFDAQARDDLRCLWLLLRGAMRYLILRTPGPGYGRW